MPRCRVCLSHGVQGEALPGLDFCAAHGGASGLAPVDSTPSLPPGLANPGDPRLAHPVQVAQGLATDGHVNQAATGGEDIGSLNYMDTELENSGATQGMADLQVSADPGARTATVAFPIPDAWLQDLADDEVLRHFSLVQASSMTQPPDVTNLSIQIPDSWDALRKILTKLAFNTSASNPWNIFGFGPLDGPEPTEQCIVTRTRTATTLCSFASESTWPQVDKDRAAAAAITFSEAGLQCEQQLSEVLRERRRLRPSKLPRWKELGETALLAVRSIPACTQAVVATQWSQILNASFQDHSATVDQHRQLADMTEKGDARALRKMGGQRVLAWAPSDSNAIQRLMAALLRQPDPQLRPLSLTLLAPIPHFPVVSYPMKRVI